MVCWKSGGSVLFPALFEDGIGSTWAVTQEQTSGMWLARNRMAVMETYCCIILMD